MKKILFLSLLLFALSCQSKSAPDYAKKAYAPQQESTPVKQEESSSPEDMTIKRKIIKTAQLRMEVKDLDASSAHIRQLVERHNGFVSNLNLSNSTYELNSEISIRVPSSNFQVLLDSIKKQAIYLDYEQIHTDDVTEEYLDIETRLKTKKEVRDRYIDILRNKAKTVKDILLAEEKIRVIQEEIESAEGRLKYLANNISLSTLTVHIFQRIEYKPSPDAYTNTFWNRLGHSFRDGLIFIEELILGLLSIWPLLLILGVFFGFRKRIFRRFRK